MRELINTSVAAVRLGWGGITAGGGGWLRRVHSVQYNWPAPPGIPSVWRLEGPLLLVSSVRRLEGPLLLVSLSVYLSVYISTPRAGPQSRPLPLVILPIWNIQEQVGIFMDKNLKTN